MNVTSIELSKQLALLPAMRGIESENVWYLDANFEAGKPTWVVGYRKDCKGLVLCPLPAYTLPELLSVLPSNIETKDCEHGGSHNCAWYGRCRFAGGLKIEKDVQDYIAGYECREHTYIAYESGALTEAAGQLVLWVAEQGQLGGEK